MLRNVFFSRGYRSQAVSVPSFRSRVSVALGLISVNPNPRDLHACVIHRPCFAASLDERTMSDPSMNAFLVGASKRTRVLTWAREYRSLARNAQALSLSAGTRIRVMRFLSLRSGKTFCSVRGVFGGEDLVRSAPRRLAVPYVPRLELAPATPWSPTPA